MSILDKYILTQLTRRLTVALSIVLLTLVFERILRLFEFVADNNGAFGLVLQMAARLLPHYLGLALPAAFFVSILLLMAQLSENSEIEVAQGAGLSLARLARPLIVFGVVLSLISLLLVGYVQPYSRYGFRAIQHAATNALWNEAIAQRSFFVPAEGVTIFANDVDLAGGGLNGIFIHQLLDTGQTVTITAVLGQVVDDIGEETRIELYDVVQVIDHPSQPPFILHLDRFTFIPDFPFEPAPFRERGRDQRELTLDELFRKSVDPDAATGPQSDADIAKIGAEAHGRLVRSISVAVMPFLAVPMGMAAKRRRRGTAIAVAAVILLLYHYTLELGGGLVGLGILSPLVGLWVPVVVFATLCMALFFRRDGRLRPSVFDGLFDALDALARAVMVRVSTGRRSPE